MQANIRRRWIIAAIAILIPTITPSHALTQQSKSSSRKTSAASSMPKYTRPGVEAAVRLSKIREERIWHDIEAQYTDMLHAKNGKELQSLDLQCEEMGRMWRENQKSPHCTMDELTTIIKWKFSKGKPRPLWKLVRSNTEASAKDASEKAFYTILSVDVGGEHEENQEPILKRAIEEFSTLKGIGPASATAFLSLYRPDLCIFMDDEVIECLYPGKRGYTTKIYLDINAKCQKLAKDLGEGWTTRRVGRALWSAARLSLCNNKIDLTLREERIGNDGGHESEKERNEEKKVVKKGYGKKTDSDEPNEFDDGVTRKRRSKRLKR